MALKMAAKRGSGQDAGGKTAKQQAALGKFKTKIADVRKEDHDDYELHKWLTETFTLIQEELLTKDITGGKARCYDVDKAVDMYKTSVAFKDKMRAEHLVDEFDPPEVLKKYMPGGLCGYDKEGSPVATELYGRLDMKGLMYSVKKRDLEKLKLQQCEMTRAHFVKLTNEAGRRVDGLTVIFDMEGVSTKHLWRPGLRMYLHLVKVLEDNYPEMMKRMFVINAPRIFPVLYKLARPLVSDDMKNKIHVLGGQFQDTLLQYVDADQLPVYLGGTQTDPDGNPRCVTKICQGGEVPRQYYLQEEESTDQLEAVTVASGSKLRLPYDVTTPGSVLRWEFKTGGFDIGFCVYRVGGGAGGGAGGGKREEVVPMERVNSHMVPEDGSVTCQHAGQYEVVFDNSFSWLRAKHVRYSVELIAPADDGTQSEIQDLLKQ